MLLSKSCLRFLFICSTTTVGCTMSSVIYPQSDVELFPVQDDKINWSTIYTEYNPRYYDSPRVRGNPSADPDLANGKFKWNALDGSINRASFEKQYTIDENGYPLNPRGRLGVKGRGLLYYWGPNHAADPIVTRWKRDQSDTIISDLQSDKPILQVIVIKRRDNGMWALPGGMIDKNEKAFTAAVREFLEEAVNSGEKTKDERDDLMKRLDKFFSSGERVYEGYVGDPRNTDNAWIETSAFNFHDESGDTVKSIKLDAGDDAKGVAWRDISRNLTLYATHSDFVKTVALRKQCHW